MLSLLLALAIQQKHSPTVYLDPGASGPAWNGQGGIKSDDIKVEHRDANGNVDGTEFVHLEYDVSCRIVPLGSDGDYPWVWVECDRECQGKKHKNHSECDLSCDKQCTKDHHFTLKGNYYELRDNMRQMEKDSAALNQRGSAGAAGPPDWSSAVSHALKAAEKDARSQVVDFTPAHITTPCTWDTREYGYHTSQFQVKGVMRKVGYYMSRGVKTPIDQEVGSHEGAVCLLYYPSKDVLNERSVEFCLCNFATFKKPANSLDSLFGPTDGGIGWETPGGDPVVPEDGKVDVSAHGKDLNEAEIDVENHTGGDLKVLIFPGLLLISDDDGTQTMVVLEFLAVLVPNGATVQVPVSVGPRDCYAPTAIKPHVVCTEISKHEPSESTKMHLSSPKDDHLTQLCRMFANDNLHFGGLDQTRAWICLSHSTRDEINQRLFPRVTAGTYLNALSDVASTGVDVEAKEYRPCIDLTLLEGATAREKAVAWFVRLWEGHDLKSLIGYAGGLVDHEKQVLAAGDSAETRHAAHLATAFMSSTEPELRDAGLRIVSDAVPEAKRDEFVRDGGLAGIWDSLGSGNEAEVGKALAIVDAYKAKTYLAQVSGLASYSPNATIKAAAQAVAAKLKE
ncbi:MAG: hypothetical protein ACHQ50_05630 [Fimbriimonadales bacterium]